MAVFGAMIELALISIALSLFHRVLAMKVGNQKQLKEHQEKMKKTQERIKELVKKDDEKSKREREGLEKEMLESMNIIMSGSTKLMLVSLVVILPVFAIMGSVYGQEVINLPVPVPWVKTGAELFNPITWGIQIYNQTNWIGWYVLFSLIFSLAILNPLVKIYENSKKKE
ncbi:MAG: DUF106 domain-containing protein [Candidatus Diapherotrites archaeon]|nr:DUF106 domain-containing protein [Candidatus Diapherotrites archaeon]